MAENDRRNYGIDLLRCLSMLFVIILHLLGQGGLVEQSAPMPGKYYILSFLQILAYCAVNLYGITTGYLMCKKSFRLSRIVNIWLITVFWSVAVSCVFFLFVPEQRTVKELISMFLPILRGRYWFFTAYFVVMLLSPVLNLLIKSLSQRQFHLLFAVLFLLFGIIPVGSLGYDVMRISGGNHFSWMIVLYLIGGYIRTNIPTSDTTHNKSSSLWLLCYFSTAAVHLLYKILVSIVGLYHYRNLFLNINSPFVITEAIFLFLYFRDLGEHISSGSFLAKLLAFVAPGVYSVYVIHVHPLVFWNNHFISLLRPWDHWNTMHVVAAVLAAALGVFTVCILLDTFRQKLFRLLNIDQAAAKITLCMEKTIRKFVS